MSSYTPFPSASTQDREENEFWLDRELSLIENALEDIATPLTAEEEAVEGDEHEPRRREPVTVTGSSLRSYH